MSSSRSDELARVALLRARFGGGSPSPTIAVGIGDDAAVLAAVGEPLVWTVDAQVDGTHFRTEWASWEDVGWRSFMAAASDLAAMGAAPIAALSSLVLAPSVTDEDLDALARGQAEAAKAVGAPVAGGNLARGTETSITTTLLGRAARPVLRAGARPGDGVWLAGSVGSAAAGLLALERGMPSTPASLASCVVAWRRPRARIDDGRRAAEHATAGIDVSDGLARDAAHVAEASGVSIVLDEAALSAHAGAALAEAAAALGRDALDLALHGGEDYALLFTSAQPLSGFTRIGVVEAYAGGARVIAATAGGRRDVDPRGFDHFAG